VGASGNKQLRLARCGQNGTEIALGRRNALLAGSPRGAEAWAILASIVNTAKLHELDRQTYLTDVLEPIVSGQTKVNALPELLPWNWKAARTTQMDAAA
jgi:transposase